MIHFSMKVRHQLNKKGTTHLIASVNFVVSILIFNTVASQSHNISLKGSV